MRDEFAVDGIKVTLLDLMCCYRVMREDNSSTLFGRKVNVTCPRRLASSTAEKMQNP